MLYWFNSLVRYALVPEAFLASFNIQSTIKGYGNRQLQNGSRSFRLTRIQLLQHSEFSSAFHKSEIQNCRCCITCSCALLHNPQIRKERLFQRGTMLRMAMPLFYEVPLRSQGLLLIFHSKVFSRRAKKTVVYQVLWLLLLHQAVISVITEHKRGC